jgi:DNA polymerase-3 subunit delta'
MQLREIIGQQQLKQHIIQNIKSGKIPHAQMFVGSMGHGGLAIALAYAQMLQCENPQETDSCGTCASCVKAGKLIHPDIHFSYPFPSAIHKDEKVKLSTELLSYWRNMVLTTPYFTMNDWMQQFDSENRQFNITVEECHDIIRRLNLKSFESKYKIMLIWLPEYLGNAGNTLLKILEEPPHNCVFMLVAESQDNILNTILSRTQIIKIPPIETEALVPALASKFDLTLENALNIASIANGDYVEAIKLLANEVNDSSLLFVEWMQICNEPGLTSNPKAVAQLIAWIEKFSKTSRENQKNTIRYGLYLMERLFYYHLSGNTDRLNDAEKNFITQFASKIHIENIELFFTQLNNCHYFLERNANVKILFMSMSLKIAQLLTGTTIEDELVLL